LSERIPEKVKVQKNCLRAQACTFSEVTVFYVLNEYV
jgi:hypothetical protein